MQNLFSKLLDKVLGDGGETFEITCAADWDNVPYGFFKSPNGLGYKSKGLGIMLRVGETVLDGIQRVTLDPNQKLPQVVFDFASARQIAPGVQNVRGTNLIDTESLPGEWDGDVRYDGDAAIGKLKADQVDGLDFGLWGGGR